MSFFLFLPHCPCPEILTNKHHTKPKLSPCLFKNTAKQGHNYPILRNSSQLFLWQIIVRLIWNSNTLRFSSKSTIFKQKIRLNCPSTMKFKDRNVAHAHCSIWSCLASHQSRQLRARLELFLNLKPHLSRLGHICPTNYD